MNERDMELAKQAGFDPFDIEFFQSIGKWSDIIRADERERIKAANAPEIERINAHLKSLEDAVQAERKHLEAELLKLKDGIAIGYLCENATGHKYFRWKKPSSVYKPIALYAKP